MVLTVEQKKAYNKKYYHENKHILKEVYKCIHNKRKYTCKECNHDKEEITRRDGDILGCDIDYFLRFVKSKMDNVDGQTEIILIKPIDYFDLSNDKENKECFHYTNHQEVLITELHRFNKWSVLDEIFWNANIKGKEVYKRIYYPL